MFDGQIGGGALVLTAVCLVGRGCSRSDRWWCSGSDRGLPRGRGRFAARRGGRSTGRGVGVRWGLGSARVRTLPWRPCSPRGSIGPVGRMAERGVDVLLLSVGADLPYLIGYEAMPLERLTMLVVPRRRRRHAGHPAPRGAPRRRAARRVRDPPVGRDRRPDRPSWRRLVGRPDRVAIGDQTWAQFLVDLIERLAGRTTFGTPARSSGRCGR